MITVFSMTADDHDLRDEIATLYGEAAFFTADQLAASDKQACAELLRSLDELQRTTTGQGRLQ